MLITSYAAHCTIHGLAMSSESMASHNRHGGACQLPSQQFHDHMLRLVCWTHHRLPGDAAVQGYGQVLLEAVEGFRTAFAAGAYIPILARDAAIWCDIMTVPPHRGVMGAIEPDLEGGGMNRKLLVHKQNLRLNLTMFPEECIISRALACTFRTRFGAMNSILCLEHATMSTFANCMPSHACIFILLGAIRETQTKGCVKGARGLPLSHAPRQLCNLTAHVVLEKAVRACSFTTHNTIDLGSEPWRVCYAR